MLANHPPPPRLEAVPLPSLSSRFQERLQKYDLRIYFLSANITPKTSKVSFQKCLILGHFIRIYVSYEGSLQDTIEEMYK